MSASGQPSDVLVVDDEPEIREMLVELIRNYGYTPAVAENGEEALRALATARPRLVLLDLRMPVMDGWEFCRRVESDATLETLPIAVVSVEALANHPRRREDAGYLRKPIDADRLVEILHRRCGAGGADETPRSESPVSSAAIPSFLLAPSPAVARHRVLLAEDDPDLGETLEAIEAFVKGLRPSAILVDLVMPVMDGWQFCEELSSHPELGAIPILLMSGSGGPLVPPKTQDLVRFFRKPFPFLQLLRTIDEVCERDPGASPS